MFCRQPPVLVSESVPGWQVEERDNCRVYSGPFCLFNPSGRLVASIFGQVVEWPRLPAEVYVYDPPPAVRQHRHGPCFQLLSPGAAWFKVHWERPPRDFDSARAFMEELVSESLRGW